MEKIIIDSIEKGKKTISAPQIAFNPVTAATVAGIKNKSNSKIIEILLKYIIFKLLAKYLKQKAEKARKSTIYKNDITYFKNLPPKNSETSRISLLIKGFKSLHTRSINSKLIIVRYNMFSHAPVEVNFRIIVGIFSIILLLITVINNAYISNLPIFSIVLIFFISILSMCKSDWKRIVIWLGKNELKTGGVYRYIEDFNEILTTPNGNYFPNICHFILI